MTKFALLSFCVIGLAQADIIPMLVGGGGVNCGVQAGIWGCDYSYTATLHDSAQLTASQQDHDEYFTLYDFNGYIGDTAIAPGIALWTITAQNVGITPSHIMMGGDDNPDIVNVTFTYVGNANVAGGSSLGTFTLRSSFGPAVAAGHFSSQATHALSNGAWIQNVGFLDVPVPFRSDRTGEVPEPFTLALIGSGLTGFVLFLRHRN